MRIRVAYCKYVRKDGTINSVTFDTETKTFTNYSGGFVNTGVDSFVEAKVSYDINDLRVALKKAGYKEV